MEECKRLQNDILQGISNDTFHVDIGHVEMRNSDFRTKSTVGNAFNFFLPGLIDIVTMQVQIFSHEALQEWHQSMLTESSWVIASDNTAYIGIVVSDCVVDDMVVGGNCCLPFSESISI